MDITGLVAVLGAFGIGPAIVYLRNRHKLEERKLELEARNGRGGGQETRQLVEENKLLRERVENLETIVCSVDFELNQKLAKMIDEHRSIVQLPNPPTPAPPAATKPDDKDKDKKADPLDRTATSHGTPSPGAKPL